MSDFDNAEEVFDLYRLSQGEQIKQLSETIVILNTKISYLEKKLRETIEENERLPVPRSIEVEIEKLVKQNKKLEKDITYYKKHVPVQLIINRESKDKPKRTGRQLR
jgi:regulator of replication initiation timing